VSTPPGGVPRPAQGEKPFFTLRSMVVFLVLATAAAVTNSALGQAQSVTGALSAVAFAVGFVCLGLLFVGGVVFAMRARSIFWLLIVLFLFPIGSIACAWWVTASGRGAGPRRR